MNHADFGVCAVGGSAEDDRLRTVQGASSFVVQRVTAFVFLCLYIT